MKRRFNRRRQIMLVSLLLSLCFLTAPTALAAQAEPAPAQINRIMLSETLFNKHLPEESSTIYTPYREDYPSMTASNTAVSLTINYENGHCAAIGALLLNGTTVSFTASGDYYTAEDTADDALLFNFVGNAGTDVMTMNLSYDRGNLSSYIYISIGTLSGNSAPIQLEFGGFTDDIYQVNEEYLKFTNSTSEVSASTTAFVNNASVETISTTDSDSVGVVRHQVTNYLTLSNGLAAAIVSYFPDEAYRNTVFEFYSKVVIDNDVLLSYLQNTMSDSPSDPIRIYSAQIQMFSNDSNLKIIGSYPQTENDDFEIVVPYLNIAAGVIDPTLPLWALVDFTTITVSEGSVTKTLVSTNGIPTKSIHDYYFGTLGVIPRANFHGSTPEEVTHGLSVHNLMTYLGTEQWMWLSAKASIVIGYTGNGTRPYSRVVKTLALQEITARDYIDILTIGQ